MKFFKKKVRMPESNATKEVDGVQVYVVTWTSRWGSYSSNTNQEFEAFIDKDQAEEFAESIRKAFKLLRFTAENKVRCYQQ